MEYVSIVKKERMNKMKDWKEELKEYIEIYSKSEEYRDIKEYIRETNKESNIYLYLRTSTEKQDFGREIIEAYEWLKRHKMEIEIKNIYCDKYTGKRLDREEYSKLRERIKKGDYIIITEISRLGRNWDKIKEEWYNFKKEEINILVMDNEQLCSRLPNEEEETMTVDKKFIQELVFNGILYAACKKIEEVSRTTKDGLKKARLKGKVLGKPRSEYSNRENFIKTLEIMVKDNLGQYKATLQTRYPERTFKKDIKKYYEKYNTKDYKDILERIKKEK